MDRVLDSERIDAEIVPSCEVCRQQFRHDFVLSVETDGVFAFGVGDLTVSFIPVDYPVIILACQRIQKTFVVCVEVSERNFHLDNSPLIAVFWCVRGVRVENLKRFNGQSSFCLKRFVLYAVSFVLITLSDFEIALNSVFFKFGLEFFSLRRTADCASLRLIRRRFRPRMNVLRRRRSCFLRLGFSARCQNKYKCG